MRLKKPFLLLFLCSGLFFYGMYSLEYKTFPYSYVMTVKGYTDHVQNRKHSAEIINTASLRLLIKKIYLDQDMFRGGGIDSIEQYLFILSNKGKLVVFDREKYSRLPVEVENVPMNIEALLKSKHSSKDDFRLEWFRVSGIHAEKTGQTSFQLFVTHHSYDETNECISHNISSLDLDISGSTVTTSNSWKTIFSAEPCILIEPVHYSSNSPFAGQMGGGKIIEHSDSTLMVSIGDYDRNGIKKTEIYSQNPDIPYGKIVLVNKNTGSWSLYAMGLRNPLGLFKSNDGTFWATDNGPRGGDELNIIEEGINYGWPYGSYGTWYDNNHKLNNQEIRGSHFGYREPIFAWIPSIAPNNLIRIEGDKFKNWKGNLLIGTMKDQSLYRIALSNDNRALYAERIFLNHRVRDMILLSDNSIALITDDGFLIILDDGGSIFEEIDSGITQKLTEMDLFDGFSNVTSEIESLDSKIASSKNIYKQHCGNCHNVDPHHSMGPHLNKLFDREVGSLDDFNFSTTLLTDRRGWSPALLKSFLLEPDKEFPNNLMSKVDLTPAQVDSIISYINGSSIL